MPTCRHCDRSVLARNMCGMHYARVRRLGTHELPKGVRLCRPSELVLDILVNPDIGPFTKEDGEVVIDAAGKRLR